MDHRNAKTQKAFNLPTLESCTAVYTRDENGAWIVNIKEAVGCHTYGATQKQARERIREALGLFIDNADTVKIEDQIGETQR